MSTEATNLTVGTCRVAAASRGGAMPQPARSYPVSRWYLRPAAARLAEWLADTPVRPVHLTACGLVSAVGAAALLLWLPAAMPLAAALVLAHWFFDRADGLLARRQQTVSAWGAWLDANVDELADVALHAATAAVVASRVAAPWPWWLLAAFLAGKYLLMYGLGLEEHANRGVAVHCHPGASGAMKGTVPFSLRENRDSPQGENRDSPRGENRDSPQGWLRGLYHLPGNADVRVHLLVLALATGYLAVELALVAAYYNLRWLVRYVLVARRLGGAR